MSFILDALRKSETERRRAASPALAGIPMESSRPAVPPWVWAVIGLLVLAVVGLTGAWWNTMRASIGPASSPAPTADAATVPTDGAAAIRADAALLEETPIAPGAPTAAAQAQTRRAATATDPAETSTIDAPQGAQDTNTAARADSAARAQPTVGERQSAAPSSRTGTGASAPSLPTLSQVVAEGGSVPDLRLELHVYHENPASRWVYINGGRYTEGQATSAGPRLVEILPQGVVMSYAGREFLVLPQ